MTIYVFVNNNGKLKYSGVSVKPGEANVLVPMSLAQGISPATYGVYLGTDPADARPHITENVPAGRNNRLIVQTFNDMKANGCGNPNYPCVVFASYPSETQCLSYLRKIK